VSHNKKKHKDQDKDKNESESESLSSSNWNIFKIIFDYLFPPDEQRLYGKLVVSDKGTLEFIFKNHPHHVCAYFADKSHHVPCNPCDPGREDVLEWHLVKHKRHCILKINWNVTSMRTIIWKVCQ